jgi:mevalonate kinase
LANIRTGRGLRRINAEIEKGYALISGTNQGIYAEVEPHPTALVLTSTTPEGKVIGPYEIPMEPKALLEEAQKGGFWSYIAGVAYQIQTHYHVRGLVINNTHTDMPMKKGLSSSAAICVLTARAFNRVYDLKMTTRGEMEMAYLGEIMTPSRCGRMDQGCAFGNRPVLMTFDGEYLDTQELQVKDSLYFVLVDLQAQKDTMEILARLNRSYPFASNDTERGVQELLGPTNKRIIHEAIDALQRADAQRLGELMIEAQALFDRYATPACPEELTAPVLHKVLNYEPLKPHIWGGKGVGSQGDGTAQFIARSEADQQAVVEIIERELGLPCLTLSLSGGPKVRKAVIPAAGFGTRLFPASKATKKELFPIVDRDGIAKPAILLIVEEALNAGLDEVIIIVQQDDLDDFRRFFNVQVSIENYNKLPRHFQDYAKWLLDIGRKVRFVTQTAQEGFGHAVYCAREAVGDEPFLLMLGDHILPFGVGEVVPAQAARGRLQPSRDQRGRPARGTPESMIGNFGDGDGLLDGRQSTLSQHHGIRREAQLDYARASLRVNGLADDEYLTLVRAVHQKSKKAAASSITWRSTSRTTCAAARGIPELTLVVWIACARRTASWPDDRRQSLRHRPAGVTT